MSTNVKISSKWNEYCGNICWKDEKYAKESVNQKWDEEIWEYSVEY